MVGLPENEDEMNKISDLIQTMDFYTIAKKYTPKNLAENLSFDEGRIFAYKLLLNKELDNELYDYAAELLDELRCIYAKEWSADWKNDLFLGDAFYLARKYDEEYAAYKRAYEKVNPPPPSLLLSLASCYRTFEPPITADEAEKLTLKALGKELSLEGVVLIRGIYAHKEDKAKFEMWDKIYQQVKHKNLPSREGVWPDMLPKDVPPEGYSSHIS
jgi:hypothetical protein